VLTVKQAWKKRIDGAFGGTLLHSVSQRIVCKIYREGRTRAIWCLQENGKRAWEREFDDEELDHYFLYGGKIYAGGTAARNLSVETGETIAEAAFGEAVLIRPPIRSGPVYVLGGMVAPKELLGLDAATLNVLWRWPDPEYVADELGLCRYVGGAMHLVDLLTFKERNVGHPRPLGVHGHCGDLWCHFEDRERFGISTVTGEVIWRQEEAESDFHADLTFVGNVAYCGGRALSAYDLKTGKLLWRANVPGNPGRLRVEGGRVYAGTKSGLVYVLDAVTGELLVSHDLKVEPTAIAPLPPNRIVVGTYKVIYCLEIE
jgi:outer membrane protein assembly factor BamB